MSQICYIRVEVKKRELISRVDLAIEMARRGIPVIIGECINPKILLKLGSNNSYFFGKCAQPAILNLFKKLIDNGWTYGALDEEGLLPDSLDSFAAQRFSSEGANTCKDIFFFGDRQKNAFDRIFGSRDSFVVSGNPRTDMWQANCYGLHDNSIMNIKKKYGNYVLLPLNFGYYTIKELHAMSSEGHLKSTNCILAQKSEFLFDKFCKLAEKLARDLKINVIIRPHPSDDTKYIKKLIAKHGVKSELVQCIGNGEAFPWISAAKLLFHNCCTTSLEAGFCGTPVVTFAPSNTSLYKDDNVNKLFPIVQTYDEALSIIKRQSEENKISSDFISQVVDWGRLSLEHSGHIASFIADRIISRNTFEAIQHKKKFSKKFDSMRLQHELIAYLSSILGKNDRKVFIDKFPRTSVHEIINIVDHICKYRGYNIRPHVTQINSHLFGFYSNKAI